jgi:hypothetical protein
MFHWFYSPFISLPWSTECFNDSIDIQIKLSFNRDFLNSTTCFTKGTNYSIYNVLLHGWMTVLFFKKTFTFSWTLIFYCEKFMVCFLTLFYKGNAVVCINYLHCIMIFNLDVKSMVISFGLVLFDDIFHFEGRDWPPGIQSLGTFKANLEDFT